MAQNQAILSRFCCFLYGISFFKRLWLPPSMQCLFPEVCSRNTVTSKMILIFHNALFYLKSSKNTPECVHNLFLASVNALV
jgi:hypothetical protein